MGRFGIMLCIALPLAAGDLVVKATMPTQTWAYHERSLGWLLLLLALLAGMAAVTQIPSTAVTVATGVFVGGLLGNMLSAAWNGMEVPNPLILGGTHAMLAFNLADIWSLVGILLLVSTIGIWMIRNRDLLPPPPMRAARARAWERLFGNARE